MGMKFDNEKSAVKLKEIQQKGIENSNKIVAIDLPLNIIDKNEDNERVFTMNEIEFLANGIKEMGFFGAIEVYKKPDGRYEISSGHRRYEAMKYLGRKTIPCIVSELPDNETRALKLLSSNIRNRKLSPLDMARAIDYYQQIVKDNKIKGDFKKLVKDFFNISAGQLYRYQCLLKLSPELQELANDPNFPYTALRDAANLSIKGQKELYDKLVYIINFDSNSKDNDSADTMITRTKVETLIASLRKDEEFCDKPKKVIEVKKENVPTNIVVNSLDKDSEESIKYDEAYMSKQVGEENIESYEYDTDSSYLESKDNQEQGDYEVVTLSGQNDNMNIKEKMFISKIKECEKLIGSIELSDINRKECIEILEALLKKIK